MLCKELSHTLEKAAIHASSLAYAPYSHFNVGAALLCDDNSIILGANIENISFGLSNCAERTALYTAILQKKIKFKAIAIYSPQAQEYLVPCGACRQVLSEFVTADFPLFLGRQDQTFTETTFSTLFPSAFQSLGSAKSSL
jgi:cytidine deaminase